MRMKFSFENHMISFEIICNHMRLFQRVPVGNMNQWRHLAVELKQSY